jgi:hypothetical protein
MGLSGAGFATQGRDMGQPTPQILKLNALDGLVAAVPYLLGFQPQESLVAVALVGPRGRMQFSMRLDLIDERYDDAIASDVAMRMAHANADKLLLLVFSEQPVADGLPRRPLIDAIERACVMPMRDALFVSRERIWSYVCDNARCCPPQGRPRDADAPEPLAVAAAHALRGDVVLPSRDAVVALVQPVGGITARSVRQAVERAWESTEPFEAEIERFDALLRRYAEPPAQVSHDEAAGLIVACHAIEVRDVILRRFEFEPDAMQALLLDVVKLAQPPHDAPICSVLAAVAYAHGNGVLTISACERALVSAPDYSLARLLKDAMERQVPPALVRGGLFGMADAIDL